MAAPAKSPAPFPGIDAEHHDARASRFRIVVRQKVGVFCWESRLAFMHFAPSNRVEQSKNADFRRHSSGENLEKMARKWLKQDFSIYG
jgi:hypothetical protein